MTNQSLSNSHLDEWFSMISINVKYLPDSGIRFKKDPEIRINIDTLNPSWKRLCPRVVTCPDATLRMYFMAHGNFCPPENRGMILSAWSKDGDKWSWDEGIRIGPHPRAKQRALAPDVVRLDDGSWRMYFEARNRGFSDVILSAQSDDMLSWRTEPGFRVDKNFGNANVGTPNVVRLSDSRWRMYHHIYDADRYEIISAISEDGLHFEPEPGVRVAQTSKFEGYSAYSPSVLGGEGGSWRMYYSGWSEGPLIKGRILSATSHDGLDWCKDNEPVLEPDRHEDSAHCSEPHCARLPDGRWRLFYEAISKDGTCRIMSATADK